MSVLLDREAIWVRLCHKCWPNGNLQPMGNRKFVLYNEDNQKDDIVWEEVYSCDFFLALLWNVCSRSQKLTTLQKSNFKLFSKQRMQL